MILLRSTRRFQSTRANRLLTIRMPLNLASSIASLLIGGGSQLSVCCSIKLTFWSSFEWLEIKTQANAFDWKKNSLQFAINCRLLIVFSTFGYNAADRHHWGNSDALATGESLLETWQRGAKLHAKLTWLTRLQFDQESERALVSNSVDRVETFAASNWTICSYLFTSSRNRIWKQNLERVRLSLPLTIFCSFS